ncbi:MAG: phosphoenolpyruvate synthase, partial [Paramuribaculum sp.]|nr:phosphoenolpyruvate synthase [Paramuribaculum sp.]
VYVRPEHFNSLNNPAVAQEIDRLNREFVERGENYILVGPGRWGSSDPALGVPVKWPNISAAKLIVESALNNYRIEPSQGTHFFHNLTSMGVGYFTIDTSKGEGICDFATLDAMPAEYESDMVRIVRFDRPLEIGLNGMKGNGVVLKPGDEDSQLSNS